MTSRSLAECANRGLARLGQQGENAWQTRGPSTASMNEEGIEQSTPLMNDFGKSRAGF